MITHNRFVLGQYYPGSIGQVVEAHAVYYSQNWGFDVSFESQVAKELGEFMGSFNPRISGFWTAHMGNSFVGSIAIDGETFHTDGARLRWFIVQPDHSGKNLGKQLLRAAMEFCSSAGHNKVFLWTFRGLQCARSLYERIGFRLVEEREVAQWGGIIFEQKFELITGNMNLEVLIDNTV